MRGVAVLQNAVVNSYNSNEKIITMTIYMIILVGFHVYVGLSIAYDFNNAIALMVLVLIAWFFIAYFLLFKPLAGEVLERAVVDPTARVFVKVFNFRIFHIPVIKL